MHSNCYNYINLDHNKYPKDVMVHGFKKFLIIISCLLFTYIQKIERVNSFSKIDVAFLNLILMTLILERIYLSSF